MSDDDYDQMCDLMHGTVELRKNHLIPFLAKHQNEPNFAELFDATFEQIASNNREVFYIVNADKTNISILRPISDLITGGTQKKNDFCKSLITDIQGASFEGAFSGDAAGRVDVEPGEYSLFISTKEDKTTGTMTIVPTAADAADVPQVLGEEAAAS